MLEPDLLWRMRLVITWEWVMIIAVTMAAVIILVISIDLLGQEAQWATLSVQLDGLNVPDTILSILMQKNFGVMAVSRISQALVPNLHVKMGVLAPKLKMEGLVVLVHQELQEQNVKIIQTVIPMGKIMAAQRKTNVKNGTVIVIRIRTA